MRPLRVMILPAECAVWPQKMLVPAQQCWQQCAACVGGRVAWGPDRHMATSCEVECHSSGVAGVAALPVQWLQRTGLR